MPDNRIDAALTPAQTDAVLDHLQAARDALPFLLNLPEAERQRMARFGSGDLPFVRRTAEVGRQHPDVLPRRLDVEAQGKDLALYDELERVRLAAVAFLELIADTQRVLGDEMFASAREVYAAVQRSRGESAALDAIYRELAQHFDRPARPPEGPTA